jgi:hypothetical protein
MADSKKTSGSSDSKTSTTKNQLTIKNILCHVTQPSKNGDKPKFPPRGTSGTKLPTMKECFAHRPGHGSKISSSQ